MLSSFHFHLLFPFTNRSNLKYINMDTPYLLRHLSVFQRLTEEIQCLELYQPSLCFAPHGINVPALPCFSATLQSTSKDFISSPLVNSLSKKISNLLIGIFGYLLLSLRRHITPPLCYNVTISTRSIDSAACFMSLPIELVLQIMLYLPGPALYCLRQTSVALMICFDSPEFDSFHPQSDLASNRRKFNTDIFSAREAIETAILLNKESCTPCIVANERGLVAARLAKLRSLRYCYGCNREHFNALFLPGGEQRYDNNSRQLLCIGRIGHMTPCNRHPCKSTSWRDIEQHLQHRNNIRYRNTCVDRLHQFKGDFNGFPAQLGSPFPRFGASQASIGFHIVYGWDLPLLQFNLHSIPSLASIKRELIEKVETGFFYQKLCHHVSAEKEIRQFVHSGICKCFRKIGHRISLYKPFEKCKCNRKITLDCRFCGVVYFWLCTHRQISLSMRYLWQIQMPTSIGWLSLLDKEYMERLFTEENKYALWCDMAFCATNKSGRWESLVKENSKREHLKAQENGLGGYWDYDEATRASENSSFQNW